MPGPFFSVVMATSGRGEHIRPSIVSVLRQSFDDWELIVVGDGPAERADIVDSFESPRLRWLGVARNSGSQAAPNNLGIAAARGQWIAYLGHDDIWSATHLRAIAQAARATPRADFVVSGCLYHGPPGTGIMAATGFLAAEADVATHFIPPSSIAHSAAAARRVGPWRDPRLIVPPVDADFMLRALEAGCRFAATGRVTVHKFAAGHRYLSYLRQTSHEQAAMLAHSRLDYPGTWTPELDAARGAGRFMALRHPDFAALAPGALFARNRSNKGLERPPLAPLGRGVVMPQTAEPRALDWFAPTPGESHRWAGPNPRPKILIPFTHDGPVRITLHLVCGQAIPARLACSDCTGRRPATILAHPQGAAITIETLLDPIACSILELSMPDAPPLGAPMPDAPPPGAPLPDIHPGGADLPPAAGQIPAALGDIVIVPVPRLRA